MRGVLGICFKAMVGLSSFHYGHREANTCAYLLANLGNHQLEDLVVYSAMPLDLPKAFSDDLRGVVAPRQ